jgi:hypothetical protein
VGCGQLNLQPQSTIRNFKKASREFKIIFLFSQKDIKSSFPFVKKAQSRLKALFPKF